MKLALYLPNFRDKVTVSEIDDLARVAEELEFDSVWTLDRIVVPEASDREELRKPFGFMKEFPRSLPAASRGEFLHGLPLISYLAAITKKGQGRRQRDRHTVSGSWSLGGGDSESRDRERQQRDVPGTLDGGRQLSLMAGTVAGDPAGNQFAALGDETAQEANVLVVDRDSLGAEAADLPPLHATVVWRLVIAWPSPAFRAASGAPSS
jgi:hypothetical protein